MGRVEHGVPALAFSVDSRLSGHRGDRGREARRRVAAAAERVTERAEVEALFRAEYEPMFRLAYTMVSSNQWAEEIVQDAFLAVSDRWAKLTNPGGYLRVSVVNGARKRLRTQASRAAIQRRIATETRAQATAEDIKDEAGTSSPSRPRTRSNLAENSPTVLEPLLVTKLTCLPAARSWRTSSAAPSAASPGCASSARTTPTCS